jgi:hypothetical protein
MSAEDVDEEFAALEAGQPVTDPSPDYDLPKVSERSENEKEIDPYDSDDDRDVSVPDFIKPQVHEFGSHLIFAPFESEPDIDGMRPYFGLVSAFEPDLKNEFDALGDTWAIDHPDYYENPFDDDSDAPGVLHYWDGKIATRDTDSGENYLEYQIPIYDTSDPKKNRRVNFQFRPSLPNATNYETGDSIWSMPDDLPEGIRVQIQSSNVHPEELLELLQTLASEIGVNPEYFKSQHIHPWSRTTGIGIYVRCQRSAVNDDVIGSGGLFDRLAQFERQREGRGEHKWNNQDAFGKRHAVALDPVQLDHLYEEHTIGKLLKSYLTKHPCEAANVSTPTDHPKIEVQYNREYTPFRDHLPWFDEHGEDGKFGWRTLLDRLQEYLINALEWAEIPRTPGHPVFVSDDHFEADAKLDPAVVDRLDIVPDPIDDVVEAERDAVTRELMEKQPTDSEWSVLEAATDGRVFETLDELAEEADVSSSTASRCLRKFDRLFSKLGGIQVADDVVRDRLNELLNALEERLDQLNRGLDRLASGATTVDEDSALGQWVKRWGAKISESGYRHSDQLQIAIAGGNLTQRELLEVLRAGYDAADRTQSVDIARFASAEVAYYDRDGEKIDIGEWVSVNQGGQTKLLGKVGVDALH